MGELIKLVTFQSMEAFKELVSKGYLEADERYINIQKMGPTYEWVIENMNVHVPNEHKTKFPLWCWVRFKNGICPPKRKGEPVKGFDVKITFEKAREDVFITDYRRYSFLLNNIYIPDSKLDKELFEKTLEMKKITTDELRAVVRPDKYTSKRTDIDFLYVCEKIRNSFDKCICEDSDVLQGCVWRINFDEVSKIEILHDTTYKYGSFNYKRKNGKRFDWIKDFYNRLN